MDSPSQVLHSNPTFEGVHTSKSEKNVNNDSKLYFFGSKLTKKLPGKCVVQDRRIQQQSNLLHRVFCCTIEYNFAFCFPNFDSCDF